MNIQSLKNIQKVMDDAIANNEIAGCNALLYDDKKEIGYWQSGYADVDNKKLFNRDTICRMYSMSKPVTSAAVWSLIQKGKLDLADDVAKYLPGFAKRKVMQDGKVVDCYVPVTIKDLLNMTSGLSYGGDQDEAHKCINEILYHAAVSHKDNSYSTLDFAEEASHAVLGFVPGTQFEYGISADVLGAVVEVVTQKKFGEYLKETIFDPLEMNDTGFYVKSQNVSRLAEPYYRAPDGSLKVFDQQNLGIRYQTFEPPAFESGGAGLLSSVDDYMKFCRMMLNGGHLRGAHILNDGTVRYMRTLHMGQNPQSCFMRDWSHLSGYTYGNLMRQMSDVSQCNTLGSMGEYGWDGWMGTYMFVDPVTKLTFVFMTQLTMAGMTRCNKCIKNIIYASL